MREKESALRLGFTYAGCFLGAGYVSGQELWQFFGRFGENGFWGLLLAMALFLFFGILLLRLIQLTGIDQADTLVIRRERPLLRGIVGFLQVFFLFGIFVIMAAGVGALFHQMFGLSAVWCSGVFCAAVMVLSLAGTAGMMAVFSAVVPLLVICSVLISVITLRQGGWRQAAELPVAANPLLRNWIVAACSFVSYNLFSSIGILAPVGVQIRSRRTVWLGVLLGCVVLFAIASGIFLVMQVDPAAVKEPLPMLAVAGQAGCGWYFTYAVLLLGGMFGTSLSCVVAMQHFCYRRFPRLAGRRPLTVPALGLTAWLCSLLGFGELVGTVYPICGYCGAFALIGLLRHRLSVRATK